MLYTAERRLAADMVGAATLSATAVAGVGVCVLALRLGGAAAVGADLVAAPYLLLVAAPVALPLAAAAGPWAALQLWQQSGAWTGWHAAGASPARAAALALLLGAALGVGTAASMSWGEPLARAALRQRILPEIALKQARSIPPGVAVQLSDDVSLITRARHGAGWLGLVFTWTEAGGRGWLVAERGEILAAEAGPTLALNGAQVLWPSDDEGGQLTGPEALGEYQHPLTPKGGTRPPAALTDAELSARIQAMQSAGKPATGERIALGRRLATAALCPLLGLLAVPLGLGRGSAGARTLVGVVVLLSLAAIMRLAEAAGAAGVVSVWGAVWGPTTLLALLLPLSWRVAGLRL